MAGAEGRGVPDCQSKPVRPNTSAESGRQDQGTTRLAWSRHDFDRRCISHAEDPSPWVHRVRDSRSATHTCVKIKRGRFFLSGRATDPSAVSSSIPADFSSRPGQRAAPWSILHIGDYPAHLDTGRPQLLGRIRGRLVFRIEHMFATVRQITLTPAKTGLTRAGHEPIVEVLLPAVRTSVRTGGAFLSDVAGVILDPVVGGHVYPTALGNPLS